MLMCVCVRLLTKGTCFHMHLSAFTLVPCKRFLTPDFKIEGNTEEIALHKLQGTTCWSACLSSVLKDMIKTSGQVSQLEDGCSFCYAVGSAII